MKIDRTNRQYLTELRYRASSMIDEVVVNHLKNGGRYEAKQATVLLMSCLEFARLATDILAANGLIEEPQEEEAQA